MSQLTVYKASAGSGKTFTLTAEYIAHLLQGDPSMYRHILAVTFTNKATAEMKERILQYLWELSELPKDAKKDEHDFLQAVMNLLPSDITINDIRSRAKEALRALTHDYDHFHVETIDSFFQSLLSNLAHELGLAAGFKVDLDDKEAISKGVDRLMAELPNRKQVMDWVLNYIQERIDDNQRWDITTEVNSLARELMKEHFMRHDEELKLLLDDNKKLGAYRGKLRSIKEEVYNNLTNAAKILDEEILNHGKGYEDFSYGKNRIRPFIQNTAKGEFNEPSATIIDLQDSYEKWLKKTDLKNADLTAHAENMRQLLCKVIDLQKQALPIINSCDLSLRHINPLRLLNEIGREVNTINKENNRFMLAKTPQLFDKLVEENDSSFVFEKAGTTFRHVMIDEFQDTSSLQWKNFKKLLVENMASGNGCLLVGDVKQSIYRFRGGDWSILNNIKNEFRNVTPKIENLEKNFRSAQNVISFNNSFFPIAAKALDEHGHTDETIQQIYADVEQQVNDKTGGNVRIKLYKNNKEKEKEENEIELDEDLELDMAMEDDLALQIQKMNNEGVPYNKMAILVRNNRDASTILAHFALKYPDIQLISDEAFLLSASPAVQLIVHALRCINDKVDLNEYNQRTQGKHHNKPDTIALAYVTHSYRNDVLGENLEWTDIINRYDELLPTEFSAEKRKLLKDKPLYELCEELIKIFQLNKAEGAAPYLFAFLDHILAFLEDNPSDIERFLAFWDENLYKKAVPAGDVEAVRILTIHKSKGLAFHTVLLPYCHWDIEKNHKDELLWCEPQKAPYNELPLVPVPLSKTVENSIYAEQYAEERLQRRIENLNLLYVALTRAKQNLYIWANVSYKKEKDKKSKETNFVLEPSTIGNLICMSLEEMDTENLTKEEDADVWHYSVAEPKRKSSTTRKEQTHNPLKFRRNPKIVELRSCDNKVEFMQSNRAQEFLAEDSNEEKTLQESYISQGKLLHRLFANIRTTEDIDRSLLEFQQQGLIANDKAADNLRILIDKRMKNPIVADWFDGSWQLFNECTILSRDKDGVLKQQRPDRVMVKGKNAVIVDFKFGNPQQRYREQVEKYSQLLQRMGYNSIKAYLWYVYTGNIDEVISC